MDLSQFNELTHLVFATGSRPLVMPLRTLDRPINSNRHVGKVLGPDREHMEGMVAWDEHFTVTFRVIGLHDGVHERLLVYLLCYERVIFRKRPEVSDVMDGPRAHCQE